MSFNVMEFLEEFGGGNAFQGEVLRTKLTGGFGVFAGKSSKFFPVTNQKLAKIVKGQAEAYAKGLEGLTYEPKVAAAIQQVWYAPVISKDRQPNWTDGVWEEMKRRTAIEINGKWIETGDWKLFKAQFEGDNPPVSNDHFGKEIWVHAVYKQHPDFNPENPDKYTCRVNKESNSYELDKDGKPIPVLIRVVNHVIGETRAEAEAWLAANGGEAVAGSAPVTNEKTALESELAALRSQLPADEFNEKDWAEWSLEIFNAIHAHEDVSGWEAIGVTDSVIKAIAELTNKYPAF